MYYLVAQLDGGGEQILKGTYETPEEAQAVVEASWDTWQKFLPFYAVSTRITLPLADDPEGDALARFLLDAHGYDGPDPQGFLAELREGAES